MDRTVVRVDACHKLIVEPFIMAAYNFSQMSSKRKRVVLSLRDKVDIVNRLKEGERASVLSEKYGVGKSTISDIKKYSGSIMKFFSTLGNKDGNPMRKVMRKPENEKVENAVYMWLLQRRSCGQPISGPLLCEKALLFNKKFNGDPQFKASSGWLKRFKSRHGIRELKTLSGELLWDDSAANSFKKELQTIIDREGYDEDFVYNADETGLKWNALPCKSCVSHHEVITPSCEMHEDRVTILVCANASGTHKIPLLIIGKSKNPTCFNKVETLPVIYSNQENGWMDSCNFLEWYEKSFISEVKRYQSSIGKVDKVLLLLDSAPFHSSVEQLERDGGMFKVIFLPPVVSSMLQPMDQGVKETFKCLYRIQIIERLLLMNDNNHESIVRFFKATDLKDCCYMMAEAWISIESATLRKAWYKILKNSGEEANDDDEDGDDDAVKNIIYLAAMLKKFPGYSDYDLEDACEWLNCDIGDHGHQVLSAEQNIETLTNEIQDVDEMKEEKCKNNEMEEGPSHSEAFQSLDIVMKWLEKQEECSSSQLLCLQHLQDIAARKKNVVFKTEN